MKENTASICALIERAAKKGAAAVVFPELSITGYTCADMFYRSDLLTAAESALETIAAQTPITAIVGLPYRIEGKLYNCAAVINEQGIQGIVPKTFLPNTREFYEARWFTSAMAMGGNNQLFEVEGVKFAVEICEDMWAPIPPSSYLALKGAQIIFNLSASNELIGKADYRRSLVTGLSARLNCGYVYAGAGVGESTTDLVFGGHTIIAENGTVLAEGKRFQREPELTLADVDVDFLNFERRENYAFRMLASN